MLKIKKSNARYYIGIGLGVILTPLYGMGLILIICSILSIIKQNKYGIFVDGDRVIFQTAYRTSYFNINDIVSITFIRSKIIIKTTNSRHAMTRIKDITESVINLSRIVQNNKFDNLLNQIKG